MGKYLITGVSSGIGRELVKKVIGHGDSVWGIARRKNLLANLKKELGNNKYFQYSAVDISKPQTWKRIITQLRRKKFQPQIVIFNAAIFRNDFVGKGTTNLETTRELIETNFFSILSGVNELLKIVEPKTKFIFIGSASAFKGGGEEGIGYCASKAALSQALESLHLKHHPKYDFKIVHFGPVDTDMLPLRKKVHFIISAEKAARHIMESVDSPDHIFHYPRLLFLFLRLIKVLPAPLYLMILGKIDALHRQNKK